METYKLACFHVFTPFSAHFPPNGLQIGKARSTATLFLSSLPQRRCKDLATKGILFVGSGVSGGEEGARYGPSLMPGGSPAAWPHIKPIFQSICAQSNGEPCCDWVSGTSSMRGTLIPTP